MRIEVLVGMIASGKSTYARKRADEGAKVIALDDICRMLHCRDHYDKQCETLYREAQVTIAHFALITGHDVVIDDTHTTRRSRRRWAVDFRKRYPGLVPEIVAVRFPVAETPDEHARRRFESDSRGKTYRGWLNACIRKYRNLHTEPLSDDEGFDEIIDAPQLEAT